MTSSNIKKLLKLGFIGLFKHAEFRPKRYDGAISTLYHEVGNAPGDYCISGQIFAAQIEYLLRSNVRWFTATELARNISQINSCNNVCFTFDDGDRSAFQATLDLIEAGGKCTHYVIPGRVNQKNESTMSWEQVRELEALGAEIGSHSLTHPHLLSLSDSELRKEISDSKNELEDKLGKEVSSFAYPYGEFDSRVVDGVRAAGYICAFTTSHLYVPIKVDLYKIPRFEPTESLWYLKDLFEGRAHLFYQLLGRYLGYRNLI